MCGIAAYFGKNNATQVIYDCLKRLTYRGYDSWGIGYLEKGHIKIQKAVGDIEESKLSQVSRSSIGIGHTRWATNGRVTKANAHPHLSSKGDVAVVHNGIVENAEELKSELPDCKFRSETDTEVIANIISKEISVGFDFPEAVRMAFLKLKGRNAIVAMHKDFNGLVGARKGSPLVLGVKDSGDFLLASDTRAFGNCEISAIYLNDGDLVVLRFCGDLGFAKDGRSELLEFYDIFTGKIVRKNAERVLCSDDVPSFGGHYMLKEIYDQKQTIKAAANQDKEALLSSAAELQKAKRIIVTGSGTAGYAALLGSYLIYKVSKKASEFVIASELEYSLDSLDSGTLVIAVSQSGETADVLDGLSKAKEKGAKIIAITNFRNSALARMSDRTLLMNCGTEVAVASTKNFTGQLAVLYMLAFAAINQSEECRRKLEAVATEIGEFIYRNEPLVEDISDHLKESYDLYYIAKGLNLPIALEGAHKMKEVSYIHAEAMAAGELKHGNLSLFGKGTWLIVVCPGDTGLKEAMLSMIEAKSRCACIIGLSEENNPLFDFWVPLPSVDETFCPLVSIVPLQLLAYYTAVARGINPDKPRNLAKTVTVK